MVRLKENPERQTGEFQGCFNSTMVRLKECTCDYGKYRDPFQFHNGSIKGVPPLAGMSDLSGFNSTMVRLKVGAGVSNLVGATVSIPQWFD